MLGRGLEVELRVVELGVKSLVLSGELSVRVGQIVNLNLETIVSLNNGADHGLLVGRGGVNIDRGRAEGQAAERAHKLGANEAVAVAVVNREDAGAERGIAQAVAIVSSAIGVERGAITGPSEAVDRRPAR